MGDRRPDILVFCVDQMQAFALGCHGHPDVKTPHLDRLAAEGCSFHRAYCNNPVCMPARATLLTGLLPRQHGVVTNGTRLPSGVPTLPQALAASGYRTHAVGKLHLQPYDDPGSAEYRAGWDDGSIGGLPFPYYGFQSADFLGGHVHYNFGDYRRWLDREAPGRHAEYGRQLATRARAEPEQTWTIGLPRDWHYNDWIAQRAIDCLGACERSEPLFLWCSFPDPHHPFAAVEPYGSMYDPASLVLPASFADESDSLPVLAARRAYYGDRFRFDEEALRAAMAQTYGMITHVDDCIGRVLESLRASGRLEQTVVLFLADHGEYLGAHHLLFKAEWLYEELVRIPMVWRVPGGAAGGPTSDSVVSQIDVVPTLLDYAGIDPKTMDMRSGGRADREILPGRSLRPWLDGGASLPPQPALIEYDEDWFSDAPFFRIRALVEQRYKLVVFASPEGGLLFDLQDDPGETRNLWDEPSCAAVKARLIEQALRGFCRHDRMDQLRRSGA